MSQAQRVADPISAVFGQDPPDVTYDTIAAQVRDMKPRALRPTQFDDVVTLIEWLRDEALKIHEHNAKASEVLHARELAVTRRERDVGIRQRVHEAATRSRALLRYFKR
jgi:hypothetical protein